MKAAFINQVGPPENIQYGDLPMPTPGPRQAVVKVSAVDVNPIDTYIRSGAVAFKLPMPYVVGCDLAGVVESVGGEVTRFKAGDRVWCSNQGLFGRQGAFAEYAAVDEEWLYLLPSGVAFDDAAAISLVGITAELGLTQHVRLRAGETIFLHGGSGGVGSMVIQMAKALGARVITTAGSPEKVEHCRQLGADEVLNYKTDDVPRRVKEICPAGVNVYWESLREPNFDQAFDWLAMRGRMLVIAGRAARPAFPVGPFYVKDLSLHGFAMFNATPDEQRRAADQINRWLVEGKLKANIDRVLPLSEAAAAHRLQEDSTIAQSGALRGKIVLHP